MPIFFILFVVLLILPIAWPQIDLLASGVFYRDGPGFFLANNVCLIALHWLAYDGARILGAVFVVGTLIAWARSCLHAPEHNNFCFFSSKAWLFLFLALVIGPGLVANVGFKDHWGRARPREVVEFGGSEVFSPALVPQFQKARINGSFVSGDGAFGFFLPSFAYIVPRRISRRVFWGSMASGSVFGLARLMMGAHFFSDVVYAAFFMLATTAGLHGAMYGWKETAVRWKMWFTRSSGA